MSLRRLFSLLIIWVALLVCAAAAALALVTSRFHQLANASADAIERVRLFEELEVDVLSLERAREGAHRGIGHVVLESDLRRKLEDTLRRSRSDEERALIAEARRRIETFIAPGGDDGQGSERREVLEAFDVLEQLVHRVVAEARQIQPEAAAWDRFGNALAVLVIALLGVGIAGAFFWLRAAAFGPIFGLREVLRRFAAGERTVRAPVEGAEELRSIAAGFNSLADDLERDREDRLNLLAGVAHDLRNPLSALRMVVHVAERAGADPARSAHALGLVRRQVERLDRLVGDVLDTARVETGRLPLSLVTVDLRTVVASVTDLYRATAVRELRVEVPDTPVELDCDPFRIEQVVSNLVSNAFKYAPPDRPVTVRLSREGSAAVVAVVDEGPGIPERELKRLFEAFERGSRAGDPTPGTGLGLFVARHVAQAHGGRLEVESRAGAGSTFRLRLPLPSATAD